MAESRKPLEWVDFVLPPINLYNVPKQMKKILVEAEAVVKLTRVTWIPDDTADVFVESEAALRELGLDHRDCTEVLGITSVTAKVLD